MASQPIYQFYAELKDYKPLIWRRFQVAGNITLAQLGYVTMTLFEMKGSHLFHLEYSVNENMPDDDPAYQSEPDKILRYDIAGGDSFPETMISNTYAATEMTLRRFTSRGDATFHFFYDYGDGWEVVLRLEEVFEDSELPGKELPRVLEGQGFGIIEDCGGPAGLEHLREVFQQKSSPEYQSMREWLGTSEVDLSVFDLQDLNFRLKKLPRIFRDLYEYDYPPTKHSIDLLDRKFGIIEDCGGPAGLEHLREVFQQKSSPEYQSMREWLGTSEVDLSVFDLQDLNFRLKKLPRIFRDLYEYDYPPTKHSIDLLDRKYCKTN